MEAFVSNMRLMRVVRERIQSPSGHSFRVLQWTRSIREVECLLGPGQTVKVEGEGTRWHFHVESELTLFRSGEGTRFIGDHIGSFAAGDLVLLGERLPHYWHTKGPSSGLSVQWNFPMSHPFWAFPENLPLTDLFGRASRGLRIFGPTARVISQLLVELAQSSGTAQLGLFLTILGRLARVSEADCALLSMRSFNLPPKSHYQIAVAKAVRHLVAHFREEVRLDDLLHVTRLSRPTFARQFKKHSGHSFSEFLNRLRLQAACRELEQSDRSILDIALACGFTQVSFFNRLFRRAMRCNPSEYRVKTQNATKRERNEPFSVS